MTYDAQTRAEIDGIVRHELEQAAERAIRWSCEDRCPDCQCDLDSVIPCDAIDDLRAAIMGSDDVPRRRGPRAGACARGPEPGDEVEAKIDWKE